MRLQARDSGAGLARMLELLTLNQRVQGSSPCAPTNQINHLAGTEPDSLRPVGCSVGRFCSSFELPDSALTKRGIAREIVHVENGADIAQ
jgi:hypothetical protein